MLRAVNVPITGVPREISSVQQAATLLGFETVKAITLAFSLLSGHRQGPCKEFDYEQFWSESLARAVAMRKLADHLRAMPPDEAYTYSLLSLIGRLALVSVFPDRYANVLVAVGSEDRAELWEAEVAVFQIGADDLSALMIRDWGMPKLAWALEHESVAAKNESDARVALMAPMIHLSASMAELLVEPTTFRTHLAALSCDANRLGLDPDELASLFDLIAEEWRAAGSDLSVHTRQVPALPHLYSHASE